MQDHDHEHDLPTSTARRRIFQAAAAVGLSTGVPAVEASGAEAKPHHAVKGSLDAKLKAHVKNVVVIYLENRSFNNLFADFPGVAQPLSSVPASVSQQKDRDGSVLPTLPKIWGGMVPARQNLGGKDYLIKEDQVQGLPNAPFKLLDLDAKPLPEGLITRDLIHSFYNNQMQINGGKNDGFVAWGDSGGLVMGRYGETSKNLGLFQIAREYTLCDNFFMAAFGFTLNNLSLFGLVLAIGIVVDDAIVVVENVERNIAAGLSPREAARKSMTEVGSALIAIALVLPVS